MESIAKARSRILSSVDIEDWFSRKVHLPHAPAFMKKTIKALINALCRDCCRSVGTPRSLAVSSTLLGPDCQYTLASVGNVTMSFFAPEVAEEGRKTGRRALGQERPGALIAVRNFEL